MTNPTAGRIAALFVVVIGILSAYLGAPESARSYLIIGILLMILAELVEIKEGGR